MKAILHITSMYPTPEYPYRGIFIKRMINDLEKREYRVVLISPVKKTPLFFKPSVPEKSLTGGITIYRPRYFALPGRGKMILGLNSVFYGRAVTWVLKKFKRVPTVVHAHSPLHDGRPAWRYCQRENAKFILHLHGSDLQKFGRIKIIAQLMSSVIKSADRVLVNSSDLSKIIAHRFSRRAGVQVIGEGIDTEKFNIDKSIKKSSIEILYVGNLVKDKGVFDLLEAFSILRKKNKKMHLTLVGQGVAREALESDAIKRGLGDSVSFTGAIDSNKLRDYYSKASVTVLPSHHEGFGIVLIESLACGTPVVATRCGGPEDIVNNNNGLLVPIGKPKLLAQAMGKVLKNRYNRQKLHDEVAKKFSYEKYIDKIVENYR